MVTYGGTGCVFVRVASFSLRDKKMSKKAFGDIGENGS